MPHALLAMIRRAKERPIGLLLDRHLNLGIKLLILARQGGDILVHVPCHRSSPPNIFDPVILEDGLDLGRLHHVGDDRPALTLAECRVRSEAENIHQPLAALPRVALSQLRPSFVE